MERYAKVPIHVMRHEDYVGIVEFSAHLSGKVTSSCVGIGKTEDEAFSDLLDSLGCEEAK